MSLPMPRVRRPMSTRQRPAGRFRHHRDPRPGLRREHRPDRDQSRAGLAATGRLPPLEQPARAPRMMRRPCVLSSLISASVIAPAPGCSSACGCAGSRRGRPAVAPAGVELALLGDPGVLGLGLFGRFRRRLGPARRVRGAFRAAGCCFVFSGDRPGRDDLAPQGVGDRATATTAGGSACARRRRARPCLQRRDQRLADAELGDRLGGVEVRVVAEGLGRGAHRLLVARREGAQRVLDAVAELAEHRRRARRAGSG